ncbi:MAG: hypothetical protein LBK07_03925 [Tannerella sp.]|nr:hypothetical protein [Tannerella sp.]
MYLCLILPVVLCLPASAARKVPIAFDRYHGYTGTVDYLTAVHRAYPDITELTVIGKSFQQRPIYVLVITNRKTGATLDREITLVHERRLEVPEPPVMPLHTGKGGHMLTGATHGNEQTGTEVCLYFIDRLLSAYGEDAEITAMVDTKVFYVCPANNPDGLYNTVDLGAPQRTNSMYQTDTATVPQRRDLNGDRLMSQIRYPSPEGRYVKDPVDPRLMVAWREGETYPDPQRYSVESEAQADRGIDINRNFPEAWWNLTTTMPGGTGEYPTSAPEVHALCEFIITHPNIIMVNEYHTQGGHVYRPMGSTGDGGMEGRDIAVYDLIMGRKYMELMGVEMPEAWKNPKAIPQYRDEQRNSTNPFAARRGYVLPYEWRVPYNEAEGRSAYYGLFLDWLYKQCGIYSLVTELWNPAHDIPALAGLKDTELQRAVLTYLDEKSMNYYLDWKLAKHPKHGDVEVGGWVGHIGRNNAFPGETLERICERQWQFDLYRTRLMPQMTVNSVNVKKQSTGGTTVLEITAEVENTGALPTGLSHTERMAFNRGDVVWLTGEHNRLIFLAGNPCEKIGNLYGQMQIPGFEMRGGHRKTLRWTVAVEGREKISIVASSLKGGTVVKEVNY